MKSPGAKLQAALKKEQPLQMVGTINAMAAIMAKHVGFRAIYLSGAGVSNASYGLPDLGITNLDNVAEDAKRITEAVDLPLFVDIDTGFGGVFSIARTIRVLEKVGVAGVHIEDQESQKRCGHRPNKILATPDEMCDRIKAAVDARIDPNFIIMARTDAFAQEGLKGAFERVHMYIDSGADAIFPEALTTIKQYETFTNKFSVPILANITEFGKTPMFTIDELRDVGVSIALYPLSAFRAMNKAAEQVFVILRNQGTQKQVVNSMQTREELYNLLDYYRYEKMIDRLYKRDKSDGKTKKDK